MRVMTDAPSQTSVNVKALLGFKSSFAVDVAVLFAVYCFGLLPLAIADVAYVDDLNRTASGLSGWAQSSRYLSDILAPLLHGSGLLADIAPLSQIIAVLLMALCGAIILRSLFPDSERSVFQYLALVPFCISPYFLQCLSYRYDSPYMALSVLFAVLPVLFCCKRNLYLFLACVLCTLGSCLTYQASLGILPMCLFACFFLCWCRRELSGKGVIAKLSCSAGGFCLALVIYRLFMVKKVAYYANASLPPLREMPSAIFANFKTYCATIAGGLHAVWIVLIAVCIVAFVVGACQRFGLEENRLKPVAVLSAVTVLLMFSVSFGIYPLLSAPSFTPRSLYGFMVCVSLILLMSVSLTPSWVSKVCAVLLAYEMIAFSFTYGNALTEQKAWADFRNDEVAEQLANLPQIVEGEGVTFAIRGDIGWAPAIERLCDDGDSTLMADLVRITFYGPGWTGYQQLCNYYGLPIKVNKSADENWGASFPKVSESYYSAIYADGDQVLIVLK